MKKIIKFDPEGLKGLHFFTGDLEFPIAIATYSDQDEHSVSILEYNYQNQKFNSEQIVKWCISHNIKYQILYPVKIIQILKHPHKYLKFLKIKNIDILKE